MSCIIGLSAVSVVPVKPVAIIWPIFCASETDRIIKVGRIAASGGGAAAAACFREAAGCNTLWDDMDAAGVQPPSRDKIASCPALRNSERRLKDWEFILCGMKTAVWCMEMWIELKLSRSQRQESGPDLSPLTDA